MRALLQNLYFRVFDNNNGVLHHIVGEAEDGREAVRCVEKLGPDLLLMDLSMPRMSGMDAISEIKKRYPETKIIALTVHKTEEYLLSTLQAGVDGYVLKDATHDELVLAIHNVMAGKRYLSPGISGKVIEGYLEGKEGLLGWFVGQVMRSTKGQANAGMVNEMFRERFAALRVE